MNYCDGTAYKSHALFQSKPNAFQIILHYDELELCNPLGAKASIHKLGRLLDKSSSQQICSVDNIGVFYFSLGNLKPSLRASLQSIQLVTLATSMVIEQYEIDAILEPFMKDIYHLEQV